MDNDKKVDNVEEKEVSRKDSLIHRLEDKDFSSLKEDIEAVVAKKIYNKVQEKKEEVIANLNGVINSSKEDKE